MMFIGCVKSAESFPMYNRIENQLLDTYRKRMPGVSLNNPCLKSRLDVRYENVVVAPTRNQEQAFHSYDLRPVKDSGSLATY